MADFVDTAKLPLFCAFDGTATSLGPTLTIVHAGIDEFLCFDGVEFVSAWLGV